MIKHVNFASLPPNISWGSYLICGLNDPQTLIRRGIGEESDLLARGVQNVTAHFPGSRLQNPYLIVDSPYNKLQALEVRILSIVLTRKESPEPALPNFDTDTHYQSGNTQLFVQASLAPPNLLRRCYRKIEGGGSSFGLASPDLLEKIDRLFACIVGEYVDLPQLVVVGDQSNGKSSVLEALTNLPFPRESGHCTRFATQIIFRRSPETHISFLVIPAENTTEEYKGACCSWAINEF